jgi:hypothetical protein
MSGLITQNKHKDTIGQSDKEYPIVAFIPRDYLINAQSKLTTTVASNTNSQIKSALNSVLQSSTIAS